jgi:hypothetical protein
VVSPEKTKGAGDVFVGNPTRLFQRQRRGVLGPEEFQALAPRIDREVDAKKRLALIRETEAVMEQNPPLLRVAWEKINDVCYNYVKGHNPYDYFGIYDVVRLDTAWLDKA